MSAPLSPLEVHFNSRPKWINPCGLGPNDEVDTDVPEYRANDNELLGRIILQARNALMHAQMFKELYVQKTFNVGFAQWHESWKTNHFDWLPSSDQIPKNLGDPTPEDHLKKLELDSTLKDIYQYLQKYAVGLEQIVWDQDEDNGDFKDNFRDTEFKLRATLCEVQVTMLERSVMQHDDITRGLMTDEFRTIGNCSHRNLRDWFIFRDYMNGLEYVIQVFEYFKQKLTS